MSASGSSIPVHGRSKSDVLGALEDLRKNDLAWRKGRAFAYVYDAGKEVEEVGKAAYMAYLSENALDPTAFPSLLKFENDLIAMARTHLGGGPEVVGNFTSGGTESLILAVKTARDFARETRGITEPEIVLPITAHAAFFKACHYLGIKAVTTDIHPEKFTADVASMERAITPNTVLLVGSAASYAHGVVDPITEVAALAKSRGILCHVDGCIGGFLLPMFRKLGADVPAFDFSVPGVTSMSMDLHKYAFCPKGASVVLYRDKALRRHQIYTCSSWTGYTMVNATIQSSKSGGPLAAAWAVMNFLGQDGYMKIAAGLLEATRTLLKGIAAIPGLRVLGQPELCVLAFASDEISVFALADEMKTRGFFIQPQLAYGPSPENVHLTVQPGNLDWIAAFLEELPKGVEAVRGMDKAALTQTGQAIASQITLETLPAVMAMAGSSMGGGKMAEINHIMNALDRPLQERLISEFVNEMFTPTHE